MLRYESWFGRLMTRVFDLLLLNFIFIVTSLPIITIGPSLTALQTTMLKIVEKNESPPSKTYFNAFKENFKQASFLGTILFSLFVILLLNLNLIAKTATMPKLFGSLTYFFLILLLVYFVYLFPLIGKFKNSSFRLIKNVFLIAIGFLPYTITLLFMTFSLIFVAVFFNTWVYGLIIYFYLVIGFAFTSFLNAIFLNQVFQKVLSNKRIAAQDKENESIEI